MPSRTTSSDAGPARLRVLVVDDNQAMLARAASVLTATCIVVGQVQDGVAALVAAAVLVPDVIVLDISMPGMSGLEVAAALRAAGVAGEQPPSPLMAPGSQALSTYTLALVANALAAYDGS